MEELRQSIRQKEEQNIRNKEPMLKQAIGQELQKPLDQEFIDKLPNQSFLWNVLINFYNFKTGYRVTQEQFKQGSCYQTFSFEDFVDECMSALVYLHLLIVDNKLNQRIIEDSIQQLGEQINILETYRKIQFNQPNKLCISYTKSKSLRTEIFDHYKIKYKVAMNNQEQQSIFPSGHENLCSFPILQDSTQLQFCILGKRIRNGYNNRAQLTDEYHLQSQEQSPQAETNDFQVLSRIYLDLEEVFISFNLKSYSKEIIQPCLLTMNYNDESRDAPFRGENIIELKFQLSMQSEQRIDAMRMLLEGQQKKREYIRDNIEKKSSQIQDILSVFPGIQYESGKELRKEKEGRACECAIF